MAIKAHFGFSLPGKPAIARTVLNHFSSLGYTLEQERHQEWIFRRGSKLASLWRFDIRAYSTTLRVKAAPQSNGDTWVSCDWEVWTLMAIVTAGDIATLEAEGRQLESLLRQQG